MKTKIFTSLFGLFFLLSPEVALSSSTSKVLDQTILIVRIDSVTSVEFTIEKNSQTNTYVISGEYVDAESGDIYASYLLDGSYLNDDYEVQVPNETETFWRIYFNFQNQSSPVALYSPSTPIKIECQCVSGLMHDQVCSGGSGGCETVGESNGCVHCCTTSCTCDCVPKEVANGGVLVISAEILYFNNIQYQPN